MNDRTMERDRNADRPQEPAGRDFVPFGTHPSPKGVSTAGGAKIPSRWPAWANSEVRFDETGAPVRIVIDDPHATKDGLVAAFIARHQPSADALSEHLFGAIGSPATRSASFVVTTPDPGFDKDGEAWINGYRFVPIGETAALAVKLADAEDERARFRADCIVLEDNLAEALQARDDARNALADMTAQRDAAAENARRWQAEADAQTLHGGASRDRRGTYDADTIQACGEALIQTLLKVGIFELARSSEVGMHKRNAAVESVLRAAGMRTIREERPRCRVVTSPRFYGKAEMLRANEAIRAHFTDRVLDCGQDVVDLIDAIATALGMRRSVA